MKKEAIMYGAIGLLAGIVITGFTAGYSVNNGYSNMMRAMGVSSNNIDHMYWYNDDDNSMTMNGMVANLSGKTNDDFDKAFIDEMIVHHQGAIDMAKLAEKSAKHNELKTLAGNIINAQTTEINQMKAWQLEWGYSSTSSQSDRKTNMMGH